MGMESKKIYFDKFLEIETILAPIVIKLIKQIKAIYLIRTCLAVRSFLL